MKTPAWVKDQIWHLRTMNSTSRRMKLIKQYYRQGFSDADLWSLNDHLAELIVPRLKRFKKIVLSHPPDITYEEWLEILDKMILAFTLVQENHMLSADKQLSVDEGLQLFAKYFQHLWD